MRGQPATLSPRHLTHSVTAMTAAQTRIADTLEMFYGTADRTSEGAMAGHAYKRSVDDLDGGVGRELVRTSFGHLRPPPVLTT